MKNFEEQYTAWLDGQLGESEREAFEAELPEEMRGEAVRWEKLSALMRGSLSPDPMPHADFVNSQVLARIRSESPAPPQSARRWFPVGRLAWGGALLLAVAAALGIFLLPIARHQQSGSEFVSQVVKKRSSQHTPEAYTFAAPGGNGSVLWVEDAGYIPAGERIK